MFSQLLISSLIVAALQPSWAFTPQVKMSITYETVKEVKTIFPYLSHHHYRHRTELFHRDKTVQISLDKEQLMIPDQSKWDKPTIPHLKTFGPKYQHCLKSRDRTKEGILRRFNREFTTCRVTTLTKEPYPKKIVTWYAAVPGEILREEESYVADYGFIHKHVKTVTELKSIHVLEE